MVRTTTHVLFLALDFLLVALPLGVVFMADASGAEIPSSASCLHIWKQKKASHHKFSAASLPYEIGKASTWAIFSSASSHRSGNFINCMKGIQMALKAH